MIIDFADNVLFVMFIVQKRLYLSRVISDIQISAYSKISQNWEMYT